MRIYLHTSPNTESVPFNYQPALVGTLHKWLGENEVHDGLSLYSLSWFSHGQKRKNGFHWPLGASFFISSPDQQMIHTLINAVQNDPTIAYGMEVQSMELRVVPQFGSQRTFFAQSPIFIKRSIGRENKFYFPQDPEADQLLTETLQRKLRAAGQEDQGVQVAFDRTYRSQRRKGARYKGVFNKGTLCPVTVTGSPAAVAFAWQVGVGNGTGIGFGALK